MARLDRLGAAKDIAQIGAAIGRDFTHRLMAAVAEKSEPELAASLDRLVEAGLLLRQGVRPHATYMFKHSLIQDAAYGTLLREPRCALHARIAEALESALPGIAESQPENLARHCEKAGLTEKAARLWGAAGRQSLGRSAGVEGVSQLERALALIEGLPGTPVLRHEEISLQLDLARALSYVRGFASSQAKSALERARLLYVRAASLGEAPENPLAIFAILLGNWRVCWSAFNGDDLVELAKQFLALAEEQNNPVLLIQGHIMMGFSFFLTGSFEKARTHYECAMALYPSVEPDALVAFGGLDIHPSLGYRALALWILGFQDTGLFEIEKAVAGAHARKRAPDLVSILTSGSLTYFLSRRFQTVVSLTTQLDALSNEKAQHWKPVSSTFRGAACALEGDALAAVELIAPAHTALVQTGMNLFASVRFSYLALAHARLGQFDVARQRMHEAVENIATTKELWFEADAYRIAGEIALMSPERDAAEAQRNFERALNVARRQKARSFELRAATSLARLWRDQGKRAEGRDLLAPIYSWFTEGLDTLDLKEAKALLDGLT
jgi:tetratricopeptide (TPR) repeat protein